MKTVEDNKKIKVVEIDKSLVEHRPLISGMGICGVASSLARPWHNPITGTTLFISSDIPVSVNWHEGAHSDLTHFSILGFIIIFLSNYLHALFTELEIKCKEKDWQALRKLDAIIKRVLVVRELMISNFQVPHEMFALSIERYMIEESLDKETARKYISALDNDTLKEGRAQHKKGLKLMCAMLQKRKDYYYTGRAIHHFVMNCIPPDIVNIEPSKLLYGSWREILNNIPNTKTTIQKLVKNPPKLEDFAYLSSDYQHLPNVDVFPGWMSKLEDLLPISDVTRKCYNLDMHRSLKYELIFPDKEKQLLKFADFINVNKSSLGAGKMRLREKKEFLCDHPLMIPPPTAFIWDGESIKLMVRNDIDSLGFTLLAFKNIVFGIDEIKIKDRYLNLYAKYNTIPLFCFISYGEEYYKEPYCNNNPESCSVSCALKQLKHLSNKILLFCCSNGTIRASKILESDKYEELPFKKFSFKPKIYGYRIINQA